MMTSACTHKGQIRSVNEDNYYISDNNVAFLMVADGMGGHKGGRIASSTAIENVKSFLCESRMKECEDIPKCLQQCVEYANRAVYDMASSDEKLAGMGTTLVLLYMCGDIAYIVNVGDSRCYHIRDNKISQITKDHSIVQELFDKGKIELDDMRKHPNKNIITRAVGTDFNVKCDVFEISTKKDDGFILCSDGLSNMVDDNEILSIFLSSKNTDECVNKLIEKANEAGGTDNITVIAAKL